MVKIIQRARARHPALWDLLPSSFSFKGHVYTSMYDADTAEDTGINATLSLAWKGFAPMGISSEKSPKASINQAIREVQPRHWAPKRFRKGSTAGQSMKGQMTGRDSCLTLLRLGGGGVSLAGRAGLGRPVGRSLRDALERCQAGRCPVNRVGHRQASGSVPHLGQSSAGGGPLLPVGEGQPSSCSGFNPRSSNMYTWRRRSMTLWL